MQIIEESGKISCIPVDALSIKGFCHFSLDLICSWFTDFFVDIET